MYNVSIVSKFPNQGANITVADKATLENALQSFRSGNIVEVLGEQAGFMADPASVWLLLYNKVPEAPAEPNTSDSGPGPVVKEETETTAGRRARRAAKASTPANDGRNGHDS